MPVDYAAEGGPSIAVRVQELFGLSRHPSLAGGRVPLTLHLLSPAHRPMQITRDLPGFWRGSWHAGALRDARTLPPPPLARRPGGRRTDGAGEAAGDVNDGSDRRWRRDGSIGPAAVPFGPGKITIDGRNEKRRHSDSRSLRMRYEAVGESCESRLKLSLT